MLKVDKQQLRIPFPLIPKYLHDKYTSHNLSLRAFGIYENDLAVDFYESPLPHLVTRILHYCTIDENGEALNPSFFWELPISKRIECLFALATLQERTSMDIKVHCSNKTCQELVEITLSVGELAAFVQLTDDEQYSSLQLEDTALKIRRPTGEDQLRWAQQSFGNEIEAMQTMLGSLIIDNAPGIHGKNILSQKRISALEEELEKIDPLVNFQVKLTCPHCKSEARYRIDLQALSLEKLHFAQLELLNSVHQLAAYYHWTEKDIFSVPAWRRSRYLKMIQSEGY